MRKTVFYLIAACILIGCNNSAKQQADEQAREKFVADSVTKAIQDATTAKQNYEDQKADLQKSITALERKETELQQANIQMEANLAAANDNLRSVSTFHLLRNSNERQDQIRNASLKVNELKQALANLRVLYVQVQNDLTAAKQKLSQMQ